MCHLLRRVLRSSVSILEGMSYALWKPPGNHVSKGVVAWENDLSGEKRVFGRKLRERQKRPPKKGKHGDSLRSSSLYSSHFLSLYIFYENFFFTRRVVFSCNDSNVENLDVILFLMLSWSLVIFGLRVIFGPRSFYWFQTLFSWARMLFWSLLLFRSGCSVCPGCYFCPGHYYHPRYYQILGPRHY